MKQFFSIPFLTLCSLIVAANFSQAQSTDSVSKPNFYSIQKRLNEYYKNLSQNKEDDDYKKFKRWEWYWEPRVNDAGEFPAGAVTWNEWKKYSKSAPLSLSNIPLSQNSRTASSGLWTAMGPTSVTNNPQGVGGIGRINCIAFHPADSNTFWIGTPAGGLWKTNDGGNTWSTTTDNLPVLGISDIAIAPTPPYTTLYIATGDADLGSLYGLTNGTPGDTKSVGVLKSTDGGTAWDTTGLNWNVSSQQFVNKLAICPKNSQRVLAATSQGMYKTLNGGITWTKAQSGYFRDIVFQPGSDSILYSSTMDMSGQGNAQIYLSTDTGSTWKQVSHFTGMMRIKLAVTQAQPGLLDALCANDSGGVAGIYSSTDTGSTFTEYYDANSNCSNNLLQPEYESSACGGQGSYDLSFAINPMNANEKWLGGVNTWKSNNAGKNWFLSDYWDDFANPGVPDVHADKHSLTFHPLTHTIYECSDGGISYNHNTANDSGWVDISNGLQISEIYRIGVSQTQDNTVLCGLQDNGSPELGYGASWPDRSGGDGMSCIIDYTDVNIQYASSYSGQLYRTQDNWNFDWSEISNSLPETFTNAWVSPFAIDPTNHNTIYTAYYNVYKSTDRGDDWQALFTKDLTGLLLESLCLAPSDEQTIYTATFKTLYYTHDGGTTWTTKSSAQLATGGASITNIAVDPANANKIWITLSGYIAGKKIIASTDGGVTWQDDFSSTLPNLPVNCIAYQKGSWDGLYIGTDAGVFYKNSGMSSWAPFNDGSFPNVVVTDLQISYINNQPKLWAGTFGRGLWSADQIMSGITVSNKVASTLNLFPNPTHGPISIAIQNSESAGQIYELSLINMLGQTIFADQIIKNTGETIRQEDLSNLPKGIYLLRLKNEREVVSRKVIID